MKATQHYLALDLGATSGRAVMGSFDGERMHLREVYRFPHGPVEVGGHLHWDWPSLREHVERGLAAAAAEGPIRSVGCDSWGLDHGFLDDAGEPLELPYCYRDARTDSILDAVAQAVSLEDLFARTGVPVMGMSTLGQLVATRRDRTDLLERAHRFAFIPGMVHHHLTGTVATEYCGACSSGLCAWRTRDWDRDLIAAMDLPQGIFPEMRATGAPVGAVRADLCERLGMRSVDVYQPSGHDTALAVLAAPASPSDLVVSSGTWAMLGVQVQHPLTSREAFRSGGGSYAIPGGEWAFMRGIMGLWLLERLRAEEGLPEPAALEALAGAAPPFACLFPPDDARLLRGASLRESLGDVLGDGGRIAGLDAGTLARSILESLALFVGRTLHRLEAVTGRRVERIVVVGGGSRNGLLNQFMADATGLPVLAGAPEATAVGNLLVQAVGCGDVPDWESARAVAAGSCPVSRFHPTDSDAWMDAREGFARMTEAIP